MSCNLSATPPSAIKHQVYRVLKNLEVIVFPCRESVAEVGCASLRLCRADTSAAFSVPGKHRPQLYLQVLLLPCLQESRDPSVLLCPFL